MEFYRELHVFGVVLVRKTKMKFLTKGGIHCISRSSLGTFILCAGAHWSNCRNMMTVLLISSCIVCRAIHIICTAAFIVHDVYR